MKKISCMLTGCMILAGGMMLVSGKLEACSIHDHGCRFHGAGRAALPNGLDPMAVNAGGLVGVLSWDNSNDLDIHGLLPDDNGPYVSTGSHRFGIDGNGNPRPGEPFVSQDEHERHIYYSQYDMRFQHGRARGYITGDVSGSSANPHEPCKVEGVASCEAISIIGNDLPLGVPFEFQAYDFNDKNQAPDPSPTKFHLRAFATGRYVIVNSSHVREGVHGTLSNTGESSKKLRVILGRLENDPHAPGVFLNHTGGTSNYIHSVRQFVSESIPRFVPKFISGTLTLTSFSEMLGSSVNLKKIKKSHLRRPFEKLRNISLIFSGAKSEQGKTKILRQSSGIVDYKLNYIHGVRKKISVIGNGLGVAGELYSMYDYYNMAYKDYNNKNYVDFGVDMLRAAEAAMGAADSAMGVAKATMGAADSAGMLKLAGLSKISLPIMGALSISVEPIKIAHQIKDKKILNLQTGIYLSRFITKSALGGVGFMLGGPRGAGLGVQGADELLNGGERLGELFADVSLYDEMERSRDSLINYSAMNSYIYKKKIQDKNTTMSEKKSLLRKLKEEGDRRVAIENERASLRNVAIGVLAHPIDSVHNTINEFGVLAKKEYNKSLKFIDNFFN